jgi:hypothetical protein
MAHIRLIRNCNLRKWLIYSCSDHHIQLGCNWWNRKSSAATWPAAGISDRTPAYYFANGSGERCLQFLQGWMHWFQSCRHLHHTGVPKYLIRRLPLCIGRCAGLFIGGVHHWSDEVSVARIPMPGCKVHRRRDEISPTAVAVYSLICYSGNCDH